MYVMGIDLYNQCTTGEVAKTLNAIKSDADHVPCVLIINSSGDDIAGTLDSSYYKGQGERQGVEREYVMVSIDDSKEEMNFSIQRTDQYKQSEQASAILSRDYKGATDLIVRGKDMKTVVRRLTPLECERLQGFPDGWTDIGDWVDKKGKLHKGDADSPRYKALGNSIAIPFWLYLMRRISAQYERPATMGSLFDGIGGFPYCWEKCNGKGTAIWASEIEDFPIAVTKKRFPEEEECEEN